MASGAALGHAQQLLNPAYTPFVYGNRSGISIIDLEQTLPALRRAAALVRDVAKEDGSILFLGTRPAHKKALVKAKERLGDNGYISTDWIPGTITNSETLFGLDPILSGTYLPNLLVVLNPSENLGAIRECTARNVPTIGIVDSDMDPRIVTYAIPANMESVRTAELITGTLSIAGQEGRRMRLRDEAKRQQRQQRDREWRSKSE
jgi:small subunit ribosomal protein S2